MTIDEYAIASSARKKMALVEQMLDHADRLCGDNPRARFDLTIASPGIVVSLFIGVQDAIDHADLCDDVKRLTKRAVQVQVSQLLRLVLEVVDSADPKLTLLEQGITTAQALDMGDSPSDEVH